MLTLERIRARAALSACEGKPKWVVGHEPAATCSAALITAAKARGAAAGYAEVARWFRGAKFAEVAASLRRLATALRAAAPKLPEERSRLLADARRVDASAKGLTRAASGLPAVRRKAAAAAKASVSANAALARCRSGGAGG